MSSTMAESQSIRPLDLTKVNKQFKCLQPVVLKFVEWYNRHAPRMDKAERQECQWCLDNLTASKHSMQNPAASTIFRHYTGTAGGNYVGRARDLIFVPFYILRLLYVNYIEEVLKLRLDEKTTELTNSVFTAGQRLLEGTFGMLIKERYGHQIDLCTDDFPGPTPSRPDRWPPLGQTLTLPDPNTNPGAATEDDTDLQTTARTRAIMGGRTHRPGYYDELDSDLDSNLVGVTTRRATKRKRSPSPESSLDTTSEDGAEPIEMFAENKSDIFPTGQDEESAALGSPEHGTQNYEPSVEHELPALQSLLPARSLPSLPRLAPLRGLPDTPQTQPLVADKFDNRLLSNIYVEMETTRQRQDFVYSVVEGIHNAFKAYQDPVLEQVNSLIAKVESKDQIIEQQGRDIKRLQREMKGSRILEKGLKADVKSLGIKLKTEMKERKGLESQVVDLNASLETHFPMLKPGKK